MRIIVPHRRGIMGTVIFYLLLAILLLGMEIRKVEVHAEMEIVMEAPDRRKSGNRRRSNYGK
ncbi:MAG: hypothetical protein V8S95_00600 [Odoribacter sp.]